MQTVQEAQKLRSASACDDQAVGVALDLLLRAHDGLLTGL